MQLRNPGPVVLDIHGRDMILQSTRNIFWQNFCETGRDKMIYQNVDLGSI